MKKLVLAIIVTGIGIAIYFMLHETPEDLAVEAVDTFYAYEQDGAFSNSWAMFHPLMKEKFDKGHYIQDRAHVFMNHLGVTSFTYSISEAVKIENWSMEKGADPIAVAYKVQVSQTFKGKYGNFTLVQDVFATKVKGEWKVLWDYKK